MTDRPKDGGPAFPREYMHKGHSGMSLRDWFAGQALAGYLASGRNFNGIGQGGGKTVANTAYAFADAMLAARKGKPND
jgi:hypothetical protein